MFDVQASACGGTAVYPWLLKLAFLMIEHRTEARLNLYAISENHNDRLNAVI